MTRNETRNAFLFVLGFFHMLFPFSVTVFISPYPLLFHRASIFVMGLLTCIHVYRDNRIISYLLIFLYTQSIIMETMYLIIWPPDIYATNLFLATLDLIAAVIITVKVNQPHTKSEGNHVE